MRHYRTAIVSGLALVAFLVCTPVVQAGEPCDQIGGFYHLFGVVEAANGGSLGMTSVHFNIEECEAAPDGTEECYYFHGGDSKLESSWAKYNITCPDGFSADDCARALVAPVAMTDCIGAMASGEGNCSRVEGRFYKTPGMPACLWKWEILHLTDRVNTPFHWVGVFRFARDGEVANGGITSYIADGVRTLGDDQLTGFVTLTRHHESK